MACYSPSDSAKSWCTEYVSQRSPSSARKTNSHSSSTNLCSGRQRSSQRTAWPLGSLFQRLRSRSPSGLSSINGSFETSSSQLWVWVARSSPSRNFRISATVSLVTRISRHARICGWTRNPGRCIWHVQTRWPGEIGCQSWSQHTGDAEGFLNAMLTRKLVSTA